MSEIDERIVSMKFNNGQFENNLGGTLKSLDRLKASLDFRNSTRGMDELASSSRRFDFGNMGVVLEGISSKFLTMGTIAVTALATITHAAVNAGAQLMRALTLAPIMDGFREFETNMNSIQTILANTDSKGTSLGEVNSALDTLNQYSDKTIYNFSQMARNIGTFTAAGVDLQPATEAIKGIANLAAVSGSNAEQASTAMYQLSQALATGSVKLMDWNSVVNAGMGGEVFQKALFETGKALGTLKNVPLSQTFDQWKAAGNSFRSSLSETGEAVDKATNSAKIAADAAKMVARAEEAAAESIAAANSRVEDARESAAEVAESSAKETANAEKARTEAAERSAEEIARAEEYKAAVFEQTALDIEAALENNTRTIEENAINVQKAIDDVAEAQRRLNEALKPASADDLQAATDRLLTSQLDQADLANAIEEAERSQQRASEDLTAAQEALYQVQSDAESTNADYISARRRVEDAELRLIDLADAVERARLRQNAATRSVTEAEKELTEVREKGTEKDQAVIDAYEYLTAAQKAVVLAREQAAELEIAAEQHVRDALIASAEQRKEATDGVTKAHEEAALSRIKADEHVAEVAEQVTERQADAAERLAEAEKAAVKTRIDAQERVAEAHESAAERIASANDSAGGGGGKAKQGWLTDEVLTKTLAGFTGDLSEAQIMQMGYTKEQAAEILRMGKIAQAAATEVKTFTQLIGTVKESMGSGWSASFRLILGDFEESKKLFTGINNFISGMVQSSADARNEMLKGWKDDGGRDAAIEGFRNATKAIGSVLRPIQEAFRDIFPPMTSERFVALSESFRKFTQSLILGEETIDKIKRVFAGFFAAIEIGWTIFKGIVSVIGDVIGALSPAGSGLLSFGANAGDMLVKLNEALVAGGGIQNFFERLGAFIVAPIKFIVQLKDTVADFFDNFPDGKAQEATLDRLGKRFEVLTTFSDSFRTSMAKVMGLLDRTWDHIKTWFSELGSKLAKELKPNAFDPAIDILNVGLLGGIALLLKRFLKNGLSLDLTGGFMEKINETLGQLTNTLKTMQQDLQAKALLKIAGAVGILAVSMVALSLIDSAGLTRALVAMGAGFAQLVAVMILIDKVGAGAIKANAMAASMILLASAMAILSLAIKNLSELSWSELAKGLAGTAVGMGILVAASQLVDKNSAGMIRAGIAMTAMAIAMRILAEAVEAFGTMPWDVMKQGLMGVAIALGFIVAAMRVMPSGMALTASGLILVSGALMVLSQAVQIFGGMDIMQMVQGLGGMGGALLVIAAAMQLMPLTLPITAAGLVVLSGAMLVMAGAIKIMGSMDLESLARGVGALGVVLAMLTIATRNMQSALGGAAAMVIVSGALVVLAGVLKLLGTMSIGEIAAALGVLAGTFIILGVAASRLAPTIPALMGLGSSLALMGIGIGAFGVGIMLVAKAFEILAVSGKAGAQAIVGMIGVLLTAAIQIKEVIVLAVLSFAQGILEAVPTIIKSVKIILGHIIDTITELTPKIAGMFGTIITEGLRLIREKFPEILETGFSVLMVLLRGIRDNLFEIVTLAADIIVVLADALIENMPKIVGAAVDLLAGFLKAFADRVGDVIKAGVDFLVAFLTGIGANLIKVAETVASIIGEFAKALGAGVGVLITAGVDLLIAFLKGIADNLTRVITAGVEVVIAFLKGISDNILYVINAGATILINFLNGLAAAIRTHAPALRQAGINVASAIISGITFGLSDKVGEVVRGAVEMAKNVLDGVKGFLGINSPSTVFIGIGKNVSEGLARGISSDNSAESRAVGLASRVVRAFKDTLSQVPDTLSGIGEFNPTITPVLDLTKVRLASGQLNSLMSVATITPDVSYSQARLISKTTDIEPDGVESQPATPTEITFEQNIFSPTALTTNDIYRNTKSQIALAKEELNIA